jgi:hypothetical protein
MNEAIPLPDFKRSAVIRSDDAIIDPVPVKRPSDNWEIRAGANHFRFSEVVSSPEIKNISLFPKRKSGYIASIPSRPEGRRPSSRTWDGERWTRKLRLTSVAEAYGEDVWS